jgi:DNA-binding CsgD family transcriptional regulator
MEQLRKFMKFLDFHPKASEMARSLIVEDIFAGKATAIRICLLNPDDSLLIIGEYGYDDSFIDTKIPGTIWRSGINGALNVVELIKSGLWNDDFTEFLYVLRDKGSLQGYITIKFAQPVANQPTSQESIEDICQLVGIFLNGASAIEPNLETDKAIGSASEQIGMKAVLTQRQLLILAGMIEGKTNHELAEDLGFSVSTIRHETMRIYENLAVSDRKEAAKKAVALNII